MPKVNVEQPHSLSVPEARLKLDQLGQELADKYGLTVSWPKETEASVKRTGATGTIRIGATSVVVDLDLSFALTPIKSTVEDKIRSELQRLFAAPPVSA